MTADPAAVDDSACTILHVDMDAFFAMVEVRRDPGLRDRPMMVAGGGRSVVLSATYEARRSGVRSAMPVGQARALCPGIIVVPPDHAAYREASVAVMRLFAEVTPIVEPVSVDEAFLDVSGARRRFGRPGEIGVALRARIRDELGLPATVGASSTKFVAKLASGLAKPEGLLLVPPADVLALLHPLPITALWGVGPRTAARLTEWGLGTIGDLAATDVGVLRRALGDAAATKLHDLAWGRDPRVVTPDTAEASVGAEVTFESDTADPAVLERHLLALAERTARRARQAGQRGRTIAIKVRFDDFTTVTRSITVQPATDASREVHGHARDLLRRLRTGRDAGRRIRLLGVRLEGLRPAAEVTEQLALGENADAPGWREVQGAVDRAVERFGAAAVRPATLVGPPEASPRPGMAGAGTGLPVPDRSSPRAPGRPRRRGHGTAPGGYEAGLTAAAGPPGTADRGSAGLPTDHRSNTGRTAGRSSGSSPGRSPGESADHGRRAEP